MCGVAGRHDIRSQVIHAVRRKSPAGLALALSVALLASACTPGGTGLTGTVSIDGSSTVFPITEAMAEEFRLEEPRVRTTIGVSGTGGGFKRFCAGETDLSNASRTIKDSERAVCAQKGIEFIELQIAKDGLSVLVNAKNDFVDFLTVEDLSRIWEPGSKVDRWNQVRPDWPDKSIELFGPDTESGTFDFFSEVINGEEGASRADFTASADDNVLVLGVAGERYSLGYFGFAFFVENQDKLKAIPVDPGDGTPVLPTETSINDGTYRPLTRPLFMYVNVESLREEPAVRVFLQFYLTFVVDLVPQVGFVPLPQARYDEQLEQIRGFGSQAP